jgi:CHAD domain-containing protein
MNPGAFPVDGRSDSRAQLRQRIKLWRELLANCSRKPGRKCVHDLRVTTLRLQTSIQYWLSQREPGAAASHAAQRWMRQGKKLRRVLGPVRQADVSLNKLTRIRSSAESEANVHLLFPEDHFDAIEEMERILKRRRETAAKTLVTEIKRRRRRLKNLSRELEAAVDSFVPTAETRIADRIQALISATAADFPALDSDNFHEFRKRIKKIRYLAEVFAKVDTAAAQHAAMLKRMTGAIGEWHDWQSLTEEAARAERGNAKTAPVAEFLQAQAGRSFEHARAVCTRAMARPLTPAANSRLPRIPSSQSFAEPPARKPVGSVSTPDLRMHSERSVRIS